MTGTYCALPFVVLLKFGFPLLLGEDVVVCVLENLGLPLFIGDGDSVTCKVVTNLA
jgi:hypothetical protein